MFQPSLDPTILAIAHSKGCTYLEAAKASCDRPGRQLSLPVAMPLVQGFARFAAEALFAYEPVNDVMLFTVLSDGWATSFVTDASMRIFYVQAVWKEPCGLECCVTTALPQAAVSSLILLIDRDLIASHLSAAAKDYGDTGFSKAAAKAERASRAVRRRRPINTARVRTGSISVVGWVVYIM